MMTTSVMGPLLCVSVMLNDVIAEAQDSAVSLRVDLDSGFLLNPKLSTLTSSFLAWPGELLSYDLGVFRFARFSLHFALIDL